MEKCGRTGKRTLGWVTKVVVCTVLLVAATASQERSVSPDDSKIARVQGSGKIAVRNTPGHQSFARDIPVPNPCVTPYLSWLDSHVLSIRCEINPSVGVYEEVDVTIGKVLLSGLGFGFERSPDGRHLAFAGWVPHFSPPYERSNHFSIDGEDVYPKPTNKNDDLSVVERVGDRYMSIHNFSQPWVWSPDSRSVALVDREFDWQVSSTDDPGKEVDERYYLVVVGPHKRPRRIKLADDYELRWTDNQTIEIGQEGSKNTVKVSGLATVPP